MRSQASTGRSGARVGAGPESLRMALIVGEPLTWGGCWLLQLPRLTTRRTCWCCTSAMTLPTIQASLHSYSSLECREYYRRTTRLRADDIVVSRLANIVALQCMCLNLCVYYVINIQICFKYLLFPACVLNMTISTVWCYSYCVIRIQIYKVLAHRNTAEYRDRHCTILDIKPHIIMP